MPRVIVERRELTRASRMDAFKVETEMKARHPKAKVTSRWNMRRGTFSVTASVEGETVIQQRGNCQCCGGLQAVKDPAKGLLSLHGYKRPGFGYTVGRCPGLRFPALQITDKQTRIWLKDTDRRLTELKVRVPQLEAEETAALNALYGRRDKDVEPGSHEAKPRKPSKPGSSQSPEKHQAYLEAMEAWSKRFPKHAAYDNVREEHATARTILWHTETEQKHFAQLVAARLPGTAWVEVEK